MGRRGIIPARAGFTVTGVTTIIDRGDHPRSRGVYADDNSAWGNEAGSSPLARGLPVGYSQPDREMGIIPARAGFTRRRSGTCRRARDHPRSRGVYAVIPAPRGRMLGSSPLARGLPLAVDVEEVLAGIIPARAGFTPHHSGRLPPSGDHPRSRGVYTPPSASTISFSGSSPLARGLRPGVQVDDGDLGIIPARAGFTPSSRGPARVI